MKRQQRLIEHPERPSHSERGEGPEVRTPIDAPRDYATEGTALPYGWKAPAPDPVPVYQVEPPPKDRVLRTWHPFTLTATATPQQIAAADRRRTRLYLRNDDTDTNVFLTRKREDMVNVAAYRVLGGQTVEMFHNDEVWITASGGDDLAIVTVLIELEVEDV